MSTETDELMALIQSEEPLRDELVPWLEVHETFGPMLKHPLVFSLFGIRPGLANKQYEHKVQALKQAKEEKRWHTAVYLYERPYRLDALLGIAENLNNEEYWELVADVWIDSENIWQNLDEWREVLLDERPSRHCMMDEEEQTAFAALPDEIEIYRGCNLGVNEDGMSWTTDRSRAEWFAKRFEREDFEAIVIVAKVKKEDVIAYFTGRNESEILANDVTVVRYEEV